MDELRIRLVVERYDVETVVRTFDGELVELVVVNETCVRSLEGIIVLVGEVLRAEHVEILGAQARVKRIQNLLGDVASVVACDSLGELHVVALCGCNVTGGNLVLRNGIETIEQIERGVTIGVTNTFPDSIVQVLGKGDSNRAEHVQRRRRFELTVAFGGCHLTEDGRDSRVRLELGYNGTQEGFERTEVQVEVVIGRARRLIRTKLRITGYSGHGLFVTNARTGSHVLERVLNTDDRQHQQFRTVLVSGLLIGGQIKLKFSWHS